MLVLGGAADGVWAGGIDDTSNRAVLMWLNPDGRAVVPLPADVHFVAGSPEAVPPLRRSWTPRTGAAPWSS
jgi:hypothetical protein